MTVAEAGADASSEGGGEAGRRDRIGGAALIAGAAGTVLAMAHHPSHADAPLGGLVHGAMIALLGALAFGFLRFAIARGPARPAILAGLIAYAASLFAHLGAATINGFVVPALAARGAAGEPVAHDLFVLAWEANQALARLGVAATGAAYLFWSADLLRRPGGWARLIGALGLIAGAVPAILLLGGWLRMDVAGAFLVYAAHAAWAAAVGLYLWRGGSNA